MNWVLKLLVQNELGFETAFKNPELKLQVLKLPVQNELGFGTCSW